MFESNTSRVMYGILGVIVLGLVGTKILSPQSDDADSRSYLQNMDVNIQESDQAYTPHY